MSNIGTPPQDGTNVLITVCGGAGCASGINDEMFKKFTAAAKTAVGDRALVMKIECPRWGGCCESGLVVRVYPLGAVYLGVTADDIDEIISESVINSNYIQRLCYEGDADPSELGLVHKDGILIGGNFCPTDLLRSNMRLTILRICGKCCPCRLGGPLILDILDKIAVGEAELFDIERLREIGHAMKRASLCPVGLLGADPLLFCLNSYPEDFTNHITTGKCPGGHGNFYSSDSGN